MYIDSPNLGFPNFNFLGGDQWKQARKLKATLVRNYHRPSDSLTHSQGEV